jgi:hypothetical protein
MLFVTCCDLVENIFVQKLIFGNIDIFRQNFIFEIYLYNQIQSDTTEIMAARRQNNLTTMRLSLLHPLGTMSHRVRRGTWKKKQTKRLVNLKEKTNWLVNCNHCAEVKNSKESVLQFCVLQSNMWIFHVAEISRFQPETIQSEH